MPVVTTGFESMEARLAALRAAVSPAALAAVKAGSQPVYARADAGVPRDTERLARSGTVIEPSIDGGAARGGVSYGNAETLTDWHGLGYEIFVELGTDHHTYTIPANPFLGTATSEAMPEIAPAMAGAFRDQLRGAV